MSWGSQRGIKITLPLIPSRQGRGTVIISLAHFGQVLGGHNKLFIPGPAAVLDMDPVLSHDGLRNLDDLSFDYHCLFVQFGDIPDELIDSVSVWPLSFLYFYNIGCPVLTGHSCPMGLGRLTDNPCGKDDV